VSRFLGNLGIEAALNPDGSPILTKEGRSTWVLARPLSFETDDGEMVTAPVGFHTDLGSIPPIAAPFGLFPDGQGVRAFVIHDLLYFTAGTGVWRGKLCITRERPYSRLEADQVLREALKACGAPKGERTAIFDGVRLGGARGWGT
jgi:hypothetical protein